MQKQKLQIYTVPTYSTYRPSHAKFLFFFNDTATTEIYTLSLHDALPISVGRVASYTFAPVHAHQTIAASFALDNAYQDRKSTRLNSSHDQISYAVFCLKKKQVHNQPHYTAAIDHAILRLLFRDPLPHDIV